MITREEAALYFRQLLGGTSSWAKLASSQFVGHLSVFVSWCLREALWRLERVEQEFFLSTAINESSILAHAEDRDYVPRKATPAKGEVLFSNSGENLLEIPGGTEFRSVAAFAYTLPETVSLSPAQSVSVPVSQTEIVVVEHKVSVEEAFYAYPFDAEYSARLAGFSVEVDEQATGHFEPWEYRRLFQNCWQQDPVYDEFFRHDGRTGIRFGNGVFGKIPPLGAVIRVKMTLTDGDIDLVAGQVLAPVVPLLENTGNPANFTAVVSASISGGAGRESTREILSNLRYWPSYNNKLVWDDDYRFYLRRNISGILWCTAWGEQQQEAVTGYSPHNINRIFVSAYAPEVPDLAELVLAVLADAPVMNKNFVWVEPRFSTFDVVITGKIGRTASAVAAEDAIRATLETTYGKDSANRVETPYSSDIYNLVAATGFFAERESRFDVALSGKTEATELEEMTHLGAVTVNLTVA